MEHVLKVDCGDFLSGGRPIDSIKSQFMIKGYAKLEMDAINVGERDFMLGPQVLIDAKEQYDLPLISANVYYPDMSKRFLDPYVIVKSKAVKRNNKKIRSLKIGIFGVMLKRPILVYSKFTPKLITTDPFEETEKVLSELKGKCDIVIALAHLNSMDLQKFKMKFKEIDLIIGGHSFYSEIITDSTDYASIVQTGSKGQYVGNIELKLNKRNEIIDFNAHNKSLEIDMAESPELKTIENDYDEAVRMYYDARQNRHSSH